jgi:hypothetical protein
MAKANGNTITMTKEKLAQLLAQASNAKRERKVTGLSVSEKGTLVIKGLRRFPIGLYANEVTAIFAAEKMIRDFIKANSDKLSTGKSDD